MIQYVTFAIAVLGAVLGLINTWHALDRTRIKLKVSPAHAITFGNANPSIAFSVEVTNLSAFAVTVYDVGFFYSGTDRRSSILQPILGDGGSWPRRLEPRSSVTIYSERPGLTSTAIGLSAHTQKHSVGTRRREPAVR